MGVWYEDDKSEAGIKGVNGGKGFGVKTVRYLRSWPIGQTGL
jgi:hypothetical protein